MSASAASSQLLSSLTAVAGRSSLRQAAPLRLLANGNSPHLAASFAGCQLRAARQLSGVSSTQRTIASAALEVAQEQSSPLRQQWQWPYSSSGSSSSKNININYVQFPSKPSSSSLTAPTLLLLPAFSDVSTIEEWQEVANLLMLSPDVNVKRVIAVDWPGFGASESPSLEYDSSIMEDFLCSFVSFVAAEDPSSPLVLVGAGHAATVAVKAAALNRIQPTAISVVAPTWAGPLSIVFGNDEKMKFRYGILRGLVRSPLVGGLLYNSVLASDKNMRMQYLTHVYADADNVTPSLVTARTALTRRDGARFAPASFLSGLLDPAQTRDEWLAFFRDAADRGVRVQAIASKKSPRRSRAEMESLAGAAGVADFATVDGALLPHEEYPQQVADTLASFLKKL